MKKFKILWQNCFFEEGSKVYRAKSAKAAEQQFESDFGIDYLIIATVEQF